MAGDSNQRRDAAAAPLQLLEGATCVSAAAAVAAGERATVCVSISRCHSRVFPFHSIRSQMIPDAGVSNTLTLSVIHVTCSLKTRSFDERTSSRANERRLPPSSSLSQITQSVSTLARSSVRRERDLSVCSLLLLFDVSISRDPRAVCLSLHFTLVCVLQPEP